MSITAQDIHRIAHLARLRIDKAEIPAYVTHFNNILKLADEMRSANTENIEPMSHPIEGQHQRLREDVITEENQRALFQAIAPELGEGLYIVPKVIE